MQSGCEDSPSLLGKYKSFKRKKFTWSLLKTHWSSSHFSYNREVGGVTFVKGKETKEKMLVEIHTWGVGTAGFPERE